MLRRVFASASSASRAGNPSWPVSRWVLIASILASGMVFIDGTALSVAMPALQADMAASGANLLWVTNGFSLPLAALLLFGGALGDCFGRRKIFIAGIAAFTAASLACGLAPSVPWLIAGRVAQGVGGALMVPGALAMISSFFPPAERGKAIGAWSAFSVLATTVGPVLGGVLAGAGLWRGVFFINLPLSAVALGILLVKIPADKKPARPVPVDWWGAITVTLGLGGLTHGLIQWSKPGGADAWVVTALVVGVASLIAFVVIQRTVRHPLLPFDVFESRTLKGASALSLLFYMGFHGTLFFLPLNLIQVQGYSPALAGLTQLPLMALLVGLSQWAGRLVDRRGPRLPLTLGPALAGAGFLLFAVPGVTAGPKEFWFTYLPGFLLVGAGLGVTAAPLSTTVMDSVPAQRLGLASGINSSLTRVAGVFAIAILGPIVLAWFGQALAQRTADLHLPAAVATQLQHEAAKLADAQVPAGLTAEETLAVKAAIKASFVDAFRIAVALAAGLSWLGALIAARTVTALPVPPGTRPAGTGAH